jgi:hypothetical protein
MCEICIELCIHKIWKFKFYVKYFMGGLGLFQMAVLEWQLFLDDWGMSEIGTFTKMAGHVITGAKFK